MLVIDKIYAERVKELCKEKEHLTKEIARLKAEGNDDGVMALKEKLDVVKRKLMCLACRQ